ncbi:DUF5818 domain-containing protein [Acidicapsa ligni]|uniref:DUF5818 domain-containing protein n=1 Tax=Acidicapsa ligni TaxID=542300 RepID=UPI0021DF582C|nr:DUF5818 domain-containing protein [Acidicapsa ligni]
MHPQKSALRIVSAGSILALSFALLFPAVSALAARPSQAITTVTDGSIVLSPVQDRSVPLSRSLNGTIVKDGSTFVLRASSGSVYRLDNQQKASQFENKSVRVTGKVDEGIKLVHVESIQEMGG